MIYTYEYDTAYIPAMPMVEIKIGEALQAPTLVLKALVDSGADGCMIPIRYLKQVRARKETRIWMRTVSGTRAMIDSYTVSLQIAGREFDEIGVVGMPNTDEIIIGRNLLNQFEVTLNGLASIMAMS